MQMKRFENQVAIITGGARGIGQGIGKRLASEGAAVVLFDVLEKELDKAVESLKSEDYAVEGVTVDITDEGDVRTSIAKVVEKYGRLDILVNSAGIVGPNGCKILDYDYEDFQRVIDVNLQGAFLVTKYAIKHMVPRKYGRILLIASIGGKEGNPGMIGYAASKSGVMGIVKGVGKEYADVGITVNGLAPAVIATPMNLDTHPNTMKYMVSKIPMGRLGTVEETAAISCWIVSPEASFNSGFIFDLSGGRATF
ncbi:MAG: SDR family oxidoreductase [Saprospiraceae bacterium]|nr:SDR family oxidoreductase [Saprospiraceae bacterium]